MRKLLLLLVVAIVAMASCQSTTKYKVFEVCDSTGCNPRNYYMEMYTTVDTFAWVDNGVLFRAHKIQ